MTNSIFTDRFELKYICTISVAEKLKQELSKFIKHDTNQSYLNYSIYFDSPNFTFYREKQQGLEQRLKPRLRTHLNFNSNKNSQWYFEIKERLDKIIFKNREIVDEKILKETLHGKFTNLKKIKENNMHYFSLIKNCLNPVVNTLYKREAFVSKDTTNFRLTFDNSITGNIICTKKISKDREYILDPRLTLVELKFHKNVPNYVLNVFMKLNIKNINFSKYGRALETFYRTRLNF